MMVINLPHTRRSIDSESSSIGPRSVGGWVVCGWFGGRSAAGWRRRGLLVSSGPRARAEPCRGPTPAGLADCGACALSSLVPSRLVRPDRVVVCVCWLVWWGSRSGRGLAGWDFYPVGVAACGAGWLAGCRGLAGRARRQPGRCRRPPPAAAAAIRRESKSGPIAIRAPSIASSTCGVSMVVCGMCGFRGRVAHVRAFVRRAPRASARADARPPPLHTSIPLAAATRASAHAVP